MLRAAILLQLSDSPKQTHTYPRLTPNDCDIAKSWLALTQEDTEPVIPAALSPRQLATALEEHPTAMHAGRNAVLAGPPSFAAPFRGLYGRSPFDHDKSSSSGDEGEHNATSRNLPRRVVFPPYERSRPAKPSRPSVDQDCKAVAAALVDFWKDVGDAADEEDDDDDDEDEDSVRKSRKHTVLDTHVNICVLAALRSLAEREPDVSQALKLLQAQMPNVNGIRGEISQAQVPLGVQAVAPIADQVEVQITFPKQTANKKDADQTPKQANRSNDSKIVQFTKSVRKKVRHATKAIAG